MRRKISRKVKRTIIKKGKVLVGILFFVILIFRVSMVKAGSNDSVIEKNRIENVYAIAEVRGSDHLYYLNMYTLNGNISYCIELGVDITTEIYNSTYDFSVSNLSEGDVKYIRNVSYFGYGYDNHNDYRYYMATQEIIWEYLSGTEVEWTNVLNVNGERINIDSYKNKILSLANDYNEGNNFAGYQKGMEVEIGESVVISDKNDNLKYYDVIDCEHCSANMVDSNIYIDFDTDYIGKGSVTLGRKEVYDYDSLLYYQDGSQKLISNGNVEDKVVLTFDIKGKYMVLQLKDTVEFKHNNQFNYSGIAFTLYDKNKKRIKDISCDENGRILLENMTYGDYYVKQKIYNYAYTLNNVFQSVNFNDDEIIYIDIIPVINEIKITKLYEVGDSLVEEEGIIFDVYNIDGTLYDSLVTDKYGIGRLKIPYGEYVVKQRNTSYGYAKVEDFYVNGKANYSSALTYTLVDEVIKCNLIINSKDEKGNLILGNDFSYKIKFDDNYLDVDGISEFESMDGVLVFPNLLSYGEYEIEIINKSNVYRESAEVINFSIDDNSNFELRDGELYLEVDINYDFIKGSVEVGSYIENINIKDNNYYYDYVVDGNVELEMIAGEDVVGNGNIIYNEGDKITDIVTDDDGKYLIENLYFGNYCLVDGEGNSSCFDVFSEDKIRVDIKKKLDKGSVLVHNISSDLENINGSVIELYDNDNKLMYVGSTNDEGIIKITDLIYGDYCFKQRSVEKSYLINEDMICFSINNSEMINLEIVNKTATKKLIEVPNTFSDSKSVKKLVILLLIVLGGIIYKIKISNRD